MKTALTCLLLAAVAGAETPPPLALPQFRIQRSGLHLLCPTKPSALYFRSSPDRLCLEFSRARLDSLPASRLSLAGITKIEWRQKDLSHVACEIELAYRIPASLLRGASQGWHLQLDYRWEDRCSLGPGLVWSRQERAGAGEYLLWNHLELDSSAPLEIGLAHERLDSREKPSHMIARTGALAAVNGGYFASAGGPLGLVFRRGQLLSPHVDRRPPRTTLAVTQDRRVAFEQMVARKGQLASRSGQAWPEVELALGGGPRLLRRGQLALTTQEEELGPSGNDITRRAARTAVATTAGGKVIIATASGYRDNHLQGLSLEAMAEELRRCGGREAMNLDGGASTTMVIGEQLVSRGPSAPALEKTVATALLVKSSGESSQPAQLELSCDRSELLADGRSRARLEVRLSDPQGRPVPDGTPVRFFADRLRLKQFKARTLGGRASVEVQSVTAAGPAKVRAESFGARAEVAMQLTPSQPNQLWSLLQRSGPKRILTVQVVDHWQNPLEGISLSSEDGQEQVSDDQGQVRFEFSQSLRRTRISCPSGPGLEVQL